LLQSLSGDRSDADDDDNDDNDDAIAGIVVAELGVLELSVFSFFIEDDDDVPIVGRNNSGEDSSWWFTSAFRLLVSVIAVTLLFLSSLDDDDEKVVDNEHSIWGEGRIHDGLVAVAVDSLLPVVSVDIFWSSLRTNDDDDDDDAMFFFSFLIVYYKYCIKLSTRYVCLFSLDTCSFFPTTA
jgi:hypothetical protein